MKVMATRSSKPSWRTAWGIVLLVFTGAVPAVDIGIGDWQMHGFGSQGYVYTSRNNFFGHSENNGSIDFTEIALNVSGHIGSNLVLAAQGLYRNAGGSDREKLRLDFANLDYHLQLNEQATLGLRLGQVKNPFGLYNETRDMIWTRPGVTLPQSVYFDALGLRQTFLASDGGVLYGRYSFGDHALSAEFLASEPLDNIRGAPEFLTGLPNPRGRMEGRPLFIGRTGYSWKEGQFRLMFSIVDLDRHFASSSRGIPSGDVTANYPLASAQLNLEDWSFTGEYGQINIARSGFTPGGVRIKNTSEVFYFQTQYRFTPEWTALLRYDALFLNIDDRSGKRTAEAYRRATGQEIPRHRFYAQDITAGLRWEITRNWLLAAEYHRVKGTAWLSPVDNTNLDNTQLLLDERGSENWDLYTIMVSFRF